MSPNVEPEEAEAILQAAQPAGAARAVREVAPRDFGQPLRLSRRALESSARDVRAALAASEKALARLLGGACELELAELAEVSAEGLFDELAAPFALLRFAVAGQPGWARWELRGAVAAVETALGDAASQGGERALSLVEQRLLQRLLSDPLTRVGAALGLAVEGLQVVAKPEDAGSWRDGGASADRQRVRLHLVLDGPGGPSAIDLYLPGLTGRGDERAAPPAAQVPEHLCGVTVELCAHLGKSEVPLAELLRLEEGDVIPLATTGDGLVQLLVGGVACASARLGSSAGRLALQVEAVGRDDSPSPSR